MQLYTRASMNRELLYAERRTLYAIIPKATTTTKRKKEKTKIQFHYILNMRFLYTLAIVLLVLYKL